MLLAPKWRRFCRVKDGERVLFFSMGTSFTAAALGADGAAKDVSLLIGSGFVSGHAASAAALLRRHPRLRKADA